MPKPTTMRLSDEQMDKIKFVAEVLGITMSDLLREAVTDYLLKVNGNVEFRVRLKKRIEHDEAILKRLS